MERNTGSELNRCREVARELGPGKKQRKVTITARTKPNRLRRSRRLESEDLVRSLNTSIFASCRALSNPSSEGGRRDDSLSQGGGELRTTSPFRRKLVLKGRDADCRRGVEFSCPSATNITVPEKRNGLFLLESKKRSLDPTHAITQAVLDREKCRKSWA